MAELTYAPEMAFRGRRNYVHSTDLYAAILDGFSHLGLGMPDGPVEINLRRPVVTQPVICYASRADGHRVAEAVADFELNIATSVMGGWVVESGRPVVTRKTYDERVIWENCLLEKGGALLVAETPAHPIEVITAMGVFYHNTLHPPPAGAKWLLGRLQLTRPLRQQDAVATRIKVSRFVAGKITEIRVIAGERELGSMTFLLAKVV